jgi:transcriptional regulator with XRE-family HTH domain
MGQKPTGPAYGFARNVIRVIDEARQEAGMTKAALIEASGIPANTFHTRMRGERPFDLNDIDKIAQALGCDPILLLHKAGQGTGLEAPVAPVTPLRPWADVGASGEDLDAVARPTDPEPDEES